MVKLKRFITQRPMRQLHSLPLSLSPTLFFNINLLYVCTLCSLTDSRFLSPFRTYTKPSIFLFLPSSRNCLRIRKDNRLEARFVSEHEIFFTHPSLSLRFFVCARRKKGKEPFFVNLAAAQSQHITHTIHSPTDSSYSNTIRLSGQRKMKKKPKREKSTHNKYGLKTAQLHKRRSSTTLN